MKLRVFLMYLVMAAINSCSSEEAALGSYARGFNIIIEEPKELADDYLGAIGKEYKPNKNYRLETNWARSKLDEVREAFKAGEGNAPGSMSETVDVANAALEAAEQMSTTYDAVKSYLDSGENKQDNGAKGQELHSKMLSHITAFHDNLSKLNKLLSVAETAVTQAALADADTETFGFWVQKTQLAAKQIIEADSPESFKERIEALDVTNKELSAWKAKRGELHPVFATYSSTFDKFVGAARSAREAVDKAIAYDAALVSDTSTAATVEDAVKAKGKKRKGKRQGGRKVKKKGGKKSTPRTPMVMEKQVNELIEIYNQLISLGNTIGELEANGVMK